MGKQRKDDGHKYGAKEENQRGNEMGVSKDTNEQIPTQKEDQEDKSKGHPTLIADPVSGKHILGGTDKVVESVYVPDHDRCSDDDKRDNH